VLELILFVALLPAAEPIGGVGCRILANPAEFADQQVVVTGRLVWTRESVSIAIQECKNLLTTGGHKWKPEICLMPDPNGTPLLSLLGPVIEAALPALVNNKVDILVTVEGVLRARQKYTAFPASNDRFALNGFCAFREFSSMLDAKRIPELKMVER
jgi:hypothetical protein